MTKYILLFLVSVLFITSSAMAAPLQNGEVFPNIELSGKLTTEQQNYLGLDAEGPWKLTDIDANYIIVEVYSMYCPHCQKEAPAVNSLYEELENSQIRNNMKLIGLGAGNSEFEIDFFRKKYAVKFPLFSDTELSIHEEVGSPGTPHFFLVKKDGAKLETVYSHAGRMKKHHDFLMKLKKATEPK